MDVGKPKYIRLHPADNVVVAAEEMAAGEPAGIRGALLAIRMNQRLLQNVPFQPSNDRCFFETGST